MLRGRGRTVAEPFQIDNRKSIAFSEPSSLMIGKVATRLGT
jgi:hypothetical protein